MNTDRQLNAIPVFAGSGLKYDPSVGTRLVRVYRMKTISASSGFG